MTTRLRRINTYTNNLLHRRFSCSCGRVHIIPTRKVMIEENMVEKLPAVLKELFPGNRVLVVADSITDSVAASAIAQTLASDSFKVRKIFLLEDVRGEVVPNSKNVAYVEQNIAPEVDFLLAVGSGTINDVVRLAATRAGRPYVVFATAPSMNGYPSPISPIVDEEGFKSSFPADPPLAITADVEILSQAPVEMIRAGIGDLFSKSVACADWKLQSLIKGEYYCDRPMQMISRVETECFELAEAIGQRDKEAVAVLMHSLIISGLAMTVAGSSSPSSGAEHQIAHFWEMSTGDRRRLHGALVGVATLVTSKLYEIIAHLHPHQLNPAKLLENYPPWEEEQKELRRKHHRWRSRVISQVQKKYLPKEQKLEEIERMISQWDTIWVELKKILRPSSKIKEVLSRAEAPVTIRELGISEQQMRDTLSTAKDIRSRYTILDLASDLGVLETVTDEVLCESGVLG